ncbi:MAG: hypothetical protein ACT4P9_17960 [Betaproteobacteria bacterium]
MNPLHKLDVLVVKAKARWRKTLSDSSATAEDRRKARAEWRSAASRKDRATAIWLQARSNRRKEATDRRRTIDPDWKDAKADRRKAERANERRRG